MPMITCPDCGKEISERAKACPNCGCPSSEWEREMQTNDKKENEAGAYELAKKLVEKYPNNKDKVKAIKELRQKNRNIT